MSSQCPLDEVARYRERLKEAVDLIPLDKIEELAADIDRCRYTCPRYLRRYNDENWRGVLICGNGGSAANSIHMASDLRSQCVNAHSLCENISFLTATANDYDYSRIFSEAMEPYPLLTIEHMLIVLSGSGNSPNVLDAIKNADAYAMTSWAIVGFDGGRAGKQATKCIHIPVDDMEIAEDCQLIISHMVKRCLSLL